VVFKPGDVANPTGIGGFKAGEGSPNPSGRPKGAQEIQNRALGMCHRALDVLGELMEGKVEDKSLGQLQLSAASLILDRGCGKAGQHLALDVDIKRRLSNLSREELIALREKYLAISRPEPKVIEHQEQSEEQEANEL
jgi:hypothetical protein